MDILFLIIIGILSRLIPHLPNMTAVGSLGLCTSAKLGIKKAFIVVSATMMVTDVLLGFHAVMWATYGCFLFTILLGQLVKKNSGIFHIAGVTFVSSLVFYIVTNLAVWVVPGSMYQHTVQGLIACYINALPFFRNSLIGDMGYSFLFFLAYEFIGFEGKRRGSTGPHQRRAGWNSWVKEKYVRS
jgi:hypothetical protein